MFVSTLDGLPTGSLLQQLSAGAAKLLLAVMAEPDARQARYIELVGYCERSVRNFGRELLALGLVRRTAAVTDGLAHDPLPRTALIQSDPPSSGRSGEPTLAAQPLATHQTASAEGAEATPRRGASRSARRARWVTAEVDPLADLSEAQRARYDRLRAEGIDHPGARNLAQICDDDLICAALVYIANRQPQSRTRYLVWCLRTPDKWYTGSFGAPTVELNEAIPVPTPDVPSEVMWTADEVPMPTAEPVITVEAVPSQAEIGNQLVSALTADAGQTLTAGLQLTEDNRDAVLLAYAVEAATGADLRLNVEAQRAVQALQQTGYTAEDVGRFADEVFPKTDWRGQKHERPTLALLLAGIGAVRHSSASYPIGGLYARVQAIRQHLPSHLSLHRLSDLWQATQEAIAVEDWQASHCSACGWPLSMCRCIGLPTDAKA